MKILLVSTSVVRVGETRYGGIELMCGVLAGALAKEHEVTIAAPYGSVMPPGVSLFETVKLPEEQDRDEIIDQKVRTIESEFDIIHDMSHRHVLKEFAKALHTVWDPVVLNYNFKTHKNATCVSEWQRLRYEEAYGRKAITVDPWLDTEVFKPALNPRRERYLFLGKLSISKGAHKAIEYAINHKLGLDVVGGLIPSDDHQYLDLISPYCKGEIKLHFNVTEEEKLDFIQNAKAVVYSPMQLEAHCLVGMEAWACGTDFLVSDAGPLHEIFAPVPNLREEAVKRWGLAGAVDRWVKLYQKVRDGFTWA